MLAKIKTEHKEVAATTADEVLVIKKLAELQPGDRILVDYARNWNEVAQPDGNKIDGLYRYDPYTVKEVTQHVQVKVNIGAYECLGNDHVEIQGSSQLMLGIDIKVGDTILVKGKPILVTRVEQY